MGKLIEKRQCPQCKDTGRDNLAVYEDGSYCFACGYSEVDDNAQHRATSEPDEAIIASQSDANSLLQGEYQPIPHRGISEKTCKKFKYAVGLDKHSKPVHIANYCDDTGVAIAQKLRFAGKKFAIVGQTEGISDMLFGKHAWSPSKKIGVIVVEGEIDALSVHEVMGDSYPVVSIATGTNSALSALKANLEWLSGFGDIKLGFDMDEAGRKAVEECVALFEPGQVKIINWARKDCNEMLVAGEIGEIKKCIWNAQEYRPDSIVGVDDLMEEVLVRPKMGVSCPWPTLTKLTYGIQPNQIYTIGAGSGIGKTEFLKDLMLHLSFTHQYKVGALFLEQKPAQTLLRLVSGLVGKRLHIPGVEWDQALVEEKLALLKDKIYFYDHFGGQDFDIVAAKVRYMVKALGCKVIIIDHITALAAEMKDERRGLDGMMAKLGGLVHELNCTFFIVSHLAKPYEGKSYEEGRPVTSSAFRGSQSIQYWSSFMIGLERNKLAVDPEERLITKVRILKDRFSGEADGHVFSLKYNRELGKLEEVPEFENII